MMRILVNALVVLTFLSVPLFAAAEAPEYEVRMRIVENGAEISTPVIWVKEGSEASVSVSGENALAVGLVVNGSTENEAHLLAEIETSEKQISSDLHVRKGEWASISIGELEFHVHVEERVAGN